MKINKKHLWWIIPSGLVVLLLIIAVLPVSGSSQPINTPIEDEAPAVTARAVDKVETTAAPVARDVNNDTIYIETAVAEMVGSFVPMFFIVTVIVTVIVSVISTFAGITRRKKR